MLVVAEEIVDEGHCPAKLCGTNLDEKIYTERKKRRKLGKEEKYKGNNSKLQHYLFLSFLNRALFFLFVSY